MVTGEWDMWGEPEDRVCSALSTEGKREALRDIVKDIPAYCREVGLDFF